MKKMLFLMLLFVCSSTVFALPVSQLVFFGDSLTDDGNLYRNTAKIVPPSPYFYGRFSNGYTWADQVGHYFYDKYYTDETNYAFGGATATLNDSSTRTLEEEQTAYYNETTADDRGKAIQFIWIGANDYLHDNTTKEKVLTKAVVDKIEAGVVSLMEHGATRVMVMNLPDLSRTPYGKRSQFAERLHALTLMHNEQLAQAMGRLQRQYPMVQLVDTYAILEDLLQDPDKFNKEYGQSINNVTDDCLLLGSHRAVHIDQVMSGKAYQAGDLKLCEDPNRHVFWDAVHPSAATHQIFAALIEKQLETTINR